MIYTVSKVKVYKNDKIGYCNECHKFVRVTKYLKRKCNNCFATVEDKELCWDLYWGVVNGVVK